MNWFPTKFQFVRLYSDLLLIDFDRMAYPREAGWTWILLQKMAHISKGEANFRIEKRLFETRKQSLNTWAYRQTTEVETFTGGSYWTFLKKINGGQSFLLLPIERVENKIEPAVSFEEPIFLLAIYLWLRVFPRAILLDKNFDKCDLNYNVCYVKIITKDSPYIFNVKGRFANYSLNEPMYNYQSFDELVVPATWLSANRLLNKIPQIGDVVTQFSSNYAERYNLIL